MKATREREPRSRSSGSRPCDPRPLTFKHFRFGDLDLAQWWTLQASTTGSISRQIRERQGAPGFPRA